MLWALLVATVLAVAGILGEHYLSQAGLNPVSGTTGSGSGSGAAAPSASPPAGPPAGPQLAAPLASFMGIERLAGSPAPAVSLTDQHGRRFVLGSQRGKVVVLTFFSAACDDICPVLLAELRGAAADLGAARGRVAFVTVDTDPLHRSLAGGLRAPAGWYFLSGPLPALDRVWRAYGVTVDVSRTTGAVAHDDVMYFLDPSGRLRLRALPYAEESLSGGYHLPAALERRWSQGIARYAGGLLGGIG